MLIKVTWFSNTGTLKPRNNNKKLRLLFTKGNHIKYSQISSNRHLYKMHGFFPKTIPRLTFLLFLVIVTFYLLRIRSGTQKSYVFIFSK